MSGFVVTSNPQSFFQNDYTSQAPADSLNPNVLSVPQYGVITSTLPRGASASLPFATTPYHVGVFSGFKATGSIKDFVGKGTAVDNPDAPAIVVYVVHGRTAYEVESAAGTAVQTDAFVKSFKPLAG